MDDLYCARCGKQIIDGWVSKSGYCHPCASEIRAQREIEANQKEAHKKQMLKKYWWVILLVGITLLNSFIALTMPRTPDTLLDANGKLTTEGEIWFSIIAENAVKDGLKAPKTAEFDHGDDHYYVYSKVDTYGYSGTVTAENSFGVPLTGEYYVIFRCWGLEPDQYEIISVEIAD
ncbi:hypothetical protein SDC9_76772 [bioreactor metagenome]|uniref:Uncharacterized protein n=1 Tax=bioreactor metagenome TaxID=1076179 RepID=A0A644YW23_9ZZZZ